MLRRSLLFLSDNPTAQRVLLGAPLSRHFSHRFVAGETLEEAIEVSLACNADGLSVSLDYLGEAVTNRDDALRATEVAIQSLEALAAAGADGNISIKPSQLGLDFDDEFCRDNVRRVLERGRELGDGDGEIFVRLDMESSEYTEGTIGLTESLWHEGFRNVGTVVQSYLRRTPQDLRKLIALGSRVRLVKGAYLEPPELAFPDKAQVDRMFVEEMRLLLEEGNYPAIATHDEAIINATRRWAFEKGISKKNFEFQMLYGIRRDLQSLLREEGYRVRVYVPFGDSWYPYLMRRLAERPSNLYFITRNILNESPLSRLAHPVAIGAGVVTGALAAFGWSQKRNSR
jgi:proline dehydrogenase